MTHRDSLTPEGPGERGSQEVQKTTPQKAGTRNPGVGLGGGATDGPKSVCASCLTGVYRKWGKFQCPTQTY